MKSFENYTIKDLFAMGYKVTIEGKIGGPGKGNFLHVNEDHGSTSWEDAAKYIKLMSNRSTNFSGNQEELS